MHRAQALEHEGVPVEGGGPPLGERELASYVEKSSTKESGAIFPKLLAKALAGKKGGAGGSRGCPVCKKHLERIAFGEHPLVILDRCAEHGIWFDRTELKKVVRSCRAAAHPTLAPEPDDEDEGA